MKVKNLDYQEYFYMESFPLLMTDYLTYHASVVAHDISEADLQPHVL